MGLRSKSSIQPWLPMPWIRSAFETRQCGSICGLSIPAPLFCGWARTIACSDVYHVPAEPYAMEIEAIDSILPGEVVVVSTQQSKRNAPWGELLSTAAKARGAHGAVIDGLVRDVRKIEELGFPVLAAGIKPVDSMGRGIVTGYNVPVECGEVLVNPGDFVFADLDGVVVSPQRKCRGGSSPGSRQGNSREARPTVPGTGTRPHL